MKPVSKLFLFPLIILLLFITVPVVHAFDPAVDVLIPVNCDDPAKAWPGNITGLDQVDYYSIDNLVAGQVLTIDVDADGLSSLDSYLEVFDSAGNSLDGSNDDAAPGEALALDPYLVFTVPPDGGGTYIFGISAAGGGGGETGEYTFFLECTVPSAPSVQVGNLLGATGGDPGSIVTIDPTNSASSPRFPLGIGPIVDIEFDPLGDGLVFAAVSGIPGRIIAIDPNSGTEIRSFTYDSGAFWALESAGDTLYGVYSADDGTDLFSLVTIDRETGSFDLIESFKPVAAPVESLAYHPAENALYGVSGSNLIQIDLGSFDIATPVPMTFGKVVSLDFDPNNSLYAATRGDNNGEPGKLVEINPVDGTVIGEAGSLTYEDGSSADVTGLTFVLEETAQNEEPPPIKTLCSSSFNQMDASTESANNRLSRYKLMRKRRNSAIGLFKFQGEVGEILNLSVCLEEKETVESEQSSTWSWIQKLWPSWQPKNRVLVVIRDAIPDHEFRVKQKAVLTQDEPSLDITNVQLQATGQYYIMVIRPFRHFQNFDYCLSLESDGKAGESLVVAWPKDDSEENTPATSSTEAKTAELQSDDPVDEGSSDSGDTTPIEPAAVAPALTATAEPVSVAPASEPSTPVVEGDGEGAAQPAEGTTVDEPEEVVAPGEEAPAPTTVEPPAKVAPEIPEETTVEEPEEEAPAPTTVEPPAKVAPEIPEENTVEEQEEVATPPPTTVEPPAKVAPEIPEETETTVETEEVAPVEEPTAEAAGGVGAETTDDSGSDEVESADDDTSEVVEVDTTEEAPTL